GLTGTHNQFEGDISPTRGDYFNFQHILSVFENHLPLTCSCRGNNHDLHEPSIRSRTASPISIERYHQSVATNPYFFYGPVPMVPLVQVITTLVRLFIPGMMAHYAPSYPNGHFTTEGLHSLFGFIADDSGSLQYRPGHERIPENWYRRPTDYTHVNAAPQLEALGTVDRRALLPGGNMGAVDTFAPMDLAALTGGIYNEETLFEGRNLRCFCFQVLQLAMLSQAAGKAVFIAGESIASVWEQWMCPKLEKLNEEMYDKYPGY
ncbi:hypothetical protein DFH09DRAFT_818125, partial [Mycena vulgaris]